MKKPVHKIAVIHDLCSYGKAALTNIMPVLSAMSLEVCPIPTMILSTHTGGYGKPYINKLKDMNNFSNFISGATHHFIENNITFDSLFIGYLGTEDLIEDTKSFIKYFFYKSTENTVENVIKDSKEKSKKIFIDPICGDNGKLYSNFDMEYVESIKRLIPYGDVITPNYTEACFLTKGRYIDEGEFSENILKEICKELLNMGAKNIVITSVPTENKEENKISIAICKGNPENLVVIKKDKSKESYHGTGDIFTSVLIGEIVRGKSLQKAVEKAHNFVKESIDYSCRFDYDKREGVLLEKNLYRLL